MSMNLAFLVLGCAIVFDVADSLCNLFDPPAKSGQFASQAHVFRK
jgi:hypothetical protein